MKTNEEKSRKYYNLLADSYDDSFEGKFTLKFKEFLLEEEVVGNGDSVLDVACGNGTLLKMLSVRWDIHGYGTDISDRMIYNARKNCPDMVFEVSSCEHASFQDNFFDEIFVCAAYHHFPDVLAFATEARRLLKPGGRLFIADVNYPIIRGIANMVLPHLKAGDFRSYSPKEIRTNFEAFDFKQLGLRKRGHMQIVTLQKNEATGRTY